MKYLEIIGSSILFQGLDLEEVNKLLKLESYTITSFSPEEIIAFEGDDCKELGFILEGQINIEKMFSSGKTAYINSFSPGNIFGEAILFSKKHEYPATITAIKKSTIMFLTRQHIQRIMATNDFVFNNFTNLLSDRILMLSKRVSFLSLDSIKKKLAFFLLDYSKLNNSNEFIVREDRQKMSEILNVTRPSLSRELSNFKDEGIIDYNKNTFTILSMDKLKEILY